MPYLILLNISNDITNDDNIAEYNQLIFFELKYSMIKKSIGNNRNETLNVRKPWL